MQEGEEQLPPSMVPSDPKVRRKYATYVESALNIEDEEPETALELYKQAEELLPGSLTDSIARVRAAIRGDKTNETTTTTTTTDINTHTTFTQDTLPIPIEDFPPLPLPPPISDDIMDLPDFSETDFHNLPPPPPPALSPSLSSSTSSLPAAETSNEELELFLDQIVDFLQVMSKEDIDEMVMRKDYQLVSYLMSTTATRPPCAEHAELALKTAQCFMTTCELVPSVYAAMVDAHVASWVLRWCKYYVVPKVEAAKADENITDDDESIVYYLQLLAILCGQQSTPLSLQERELLDDQAFVTMMIQFAIHEYEYDEDSDIAFESAVVLYGISSQFPSPSEDPIVFALYGMPEAATLGRFLIHVTNRGVTPKWLQASAISTSRKLFEFSQLHQSEGFFFTNDMHVLLDVAVREVVNLDEDKEVLRMEYMKLMHAIITHHEYLKGGKYKHENVLEVIASIAFQEYDPSSAAFAQSLFESLVANKS